MKYIYILLLLLTILSMSSCDKEDTTGTVIIKFEMITGSECPELRFYDNKGLKAGIPVYTHFYHKGDKKTKVVLEAGNYYFDYGFHVYYEKEDRYEGIFGVQVQAGKTVEIVAP